jgi:hypothetical protein
MMRPKSDMQFCASPDPSPRKPALICRLGHVTLTFTFFRPDTNTDTLPTVATRPPALKISDFDNIAR